MAAEQDYSMKPGRSAPMRKLVDRHFKQVLALSAAILISALPALGISQESNFTPQERCESKKLKARAAYIRCLTRKIIKEKRKDVSADFTTCDAKYSSRFRKAESTTGTTCVPEDEDATIELIKRRAVAATQPQHCFVSGNPPCAQITESSQGNQTTVSCQLAPTYCAANLPGILMQAKGTLTDLEFGDNPVVWIQAWGADGADGQGSDCGGEGGPGGFAQTVTTLVKFGRGDFYYYMGELGGHADDSGGQGGAATLVTKVDLTQMPSQEPQEADIILVAAGGGGQGGDNSSSTCSGVGNVSGGTGGIAIAKAGTGSPTTGAGGVGGGSIPSVPGAPGAPGDGTGGVYNTQTTQAVESGTAGFGGKGGQNGKNTLGFTGWINSPNLTFTTGEGGTGEDTNNPCPSGGAGGGGGYGGGAGGIQGDDEFCSSGGGGGASYAIESTFSDNCAPTQNPNSPSSSSGFVRIAFSLNPNVCN